MSTGLSGSPSMQTHSPTHPKNRGFTICHTGTKSETISNTSVSPAIHEGGYRASVKMFTQRRCLIMTRIQRHRACGQFEMTLTLRSKFRTRHHRRQMMTNTGREQKRLSSLFIDGRRAVVQALITLVCEVQKIELAQELRYFHLNSEPDDRRRLRLPQAIPFSAGGSSGIRLRDS
jgi:hypothetical protein